MNLKDLKAKLARPRHDCQVIKGRQTGRHRGEPKRRYGPALALLTAIGLSGTAVVTVFIVQGNPEPVAAQYQPSYNPTPPPHVFPPPQPSPAASTYTVRKDDTMWSIAYHRCGDGMKWKDIQAVNSNNPWLISPGQVLKLPAPACA